MNEDAYVDALLADLEQDLPLVGDRELISLFIGGGTPSLFSGSAIDRLLRGIRERLAWVADIEITLEANPGTVDAGHFQAYRKSGVNRLSIGIQSLDADKLRALGRIHDPDQAVQAVEIARRAGFDNINVDLMFGLPEQSVSQALADLDAAMALGTEHLSWYQLTLEPNTAFHHQPPVLPDDDSTWEMQEAGQRTLAAAGFGQYEVSAYARADRRCRHNLNYWTFGDYLGIGAGAHGKLTLTSGEVIRLAKQRHPRRYLETASGPARISSRNTLSASDLAGEFMLNALRLDKVDSTLFAARTGLPLETLAAKLRDVVDRGLLLEQHGVWQPTELGRRFLNDLILAFLD